MACTSTSLSLPASTLLKLKPHPHCGWDPVPRFRAEPPQWKKPTPAIERLQGSVSGSNDSDIKKSNRQAQKAKRRSTRARYGRQKAMRIFILQIGTASLSFSGASNCDNGLNSSVSPASKNSGHNVLDIRYAVLAIIFLDLDPLSKDIKSTRV